MTDRKPLSRQPGLGTAGNTALTGLTDNAGYLQLADGVVLTLDGTLTNTGYVQIGNGGLSAPASLTVQGLTNTGTIGISGDSTNQALLSVAADAPATWTGTVDISGNGLLEYTGTSQIGTIANGASITLTARKPLSRRPASARRATPR